MTRIPLTVSLTALAVATALLVLPLPAAEAGPVTVPLTEAVGLIPAAPEGTRTGYVRTSFRHWNAGLIAGDGCNTRAEVILAEAVEAPVVTSGCKMTGGLWFSPYDSTEVYAASSLDADHVVPLAEAWDSGASAWDAKRREDYANDQGSPDSIIAVSAASNRSKADKDPAEWMPVESFSCTYAAMWTGTKLRWNLNADDAEIEALTAVAANCPGTQVLYETVQ